VSNGAQNAQAGAAGDSRPRLIAPGPAGLALFAAAYFAAAALNVWPDLGHGLSATLWAPSGLYLALLLSSEPRRWPLIVTVAFAVDAAAELTIFRYAAPVGLSVAAINTLEALLGAVLLRRFHGAPLALDSPRAVLALLLFGAIVSPLASATLGAVVLAAAGVQAFSAVWPLWWVSDATGVLVGAPLALGMIQRQFSVLDMTMARRVEAFALVLVLSVIGHIDVAGYAAFQFLIGPTLLWAALRFALPGTILAVAMLAVDTMNHAAAGEGVFGASASPQTRALMAQLFLGTASVSSLVLATLIAQRAAAEAALRRAYQEVAQRSAALRESEAFAQAVVDGLTSHIAILDERGKIIAVNRRWREFGQGSRVPPTVVNEGADYLAVCEAAQLGNLASGIRDLLAGGRYEMSFEYPCETPIGPRWFVMRATPLAGAGPGRVVVSHDEITGRVLAEQLLRESEERLWVAQGSAGLGSFDIDLRSGEIRWDETVRKWWGLAPEQRVTQDAFLSGLHPDDVARTLAAIGQSEDPSGNGRYAVEYRVINRFDGVMRWMAASGQAFFEKGRAVRRVGMVQDITARWQAEQALRESEERLQLARAAGGFGVFDHDLVNDRIVWDARARELWGLEADEPVTRELIRSLVHPDDRAARSAAIARALDPAGDGRYHAEHRIVCRRTGTIRWVAASTQVFFADGEPVRSIGVMQDVTSRKEAEAALGESEHRLALANAAAGFASFEYDLISGELRWDAPIYEWWGLPPDRPPSQDMALAGVHPDDRAALDAVHARAADPSGDGRYAMEYRVISRTEGRTRWIAGAGQVFFERGRAVRRLGMVHDVTARKEAEQRLRASEERLSLANAAAGFGRVEHNLVTGEADWDTTVRDWWGVASDERVTQDLALGAIHPDDKAGMLAVLEKAADPAGDGRYSVEYRVINRRDGAIRWIAGAGRTFFDQGRPLRRISLLQNITARKTAEAALRESTERLQLARSAADLGIYDIDLITGELRWDERVRELWGVSPDEQITREISVSALAEEDLALTQAALERAYDPNGDGRYQAEYRVRNRRDGVTRWVAAVGQVFFANGRAARLVGTVQDITARKAAEQALERAKAELEIRVAERTAALRVSEQRMRALVELSSDWYWEQDAEFRFVDFADTPLTPLGLDRGLYVGRTRWELPVHGVSEAQWRAHRTQLERHERFRDFEFYWLGERGEALWVSVSGDPIFDEAGRFAGYRGVGRNVTERRRAAEELARAKERLELALGATSDMVFEADLCRDVIYLYGSPIRGGPGSVAEVAFEQVLEAVHPDDHAQVRRAHAQLHDGTASEIAYEYRLRLQSAGWAWRLLRGQVTKRDPASGRALAVAGTSVDITERKLAEHAVAESAARFRALVEMSSDWYWEQDENFRFVSLSENMFQNSGLDPAAFIGKTRGELPLIGVSAESLAGNRALLDRHEPFRNFESCLMNTRGELVWVSTSGDPVFDATGRFTGYRGVARNTTARRRFEEAQAALAHAQRMEAVGQLTGGLAHDMNNLLTIVSGNLELADRRIADEEARDMLRRARDAVTIGANLNRRLLIFARQRRLDPVLLVLNERVTEMAELLRRTLGSPVSLTTRLAEDLWPTRADPGEIDNAVLNLALNARDAMPHGGALTIATDNVTLDGGAAARHPGAQPGDYVRLSVADTGTGMSPEVLRRAVEPFFTTKEVGKGTGLGLSSVYGFATQSGGFLTIDSEIGKGTTVRIHLPRALERYAAPAPDSVDRDPRGAGELVLVVEDNERVGEVARQHLQSLGYLVRSAGDGPAALRVLQSDEPFALVFSDVVMSGGMSGYDVVRWAQKQKPGLRFLLTSGYEASAIPADRAAFKSIRVLAKPYSRAQLARAIRAALGS
jgi:PAS domain S-box-containing protein